MRGKKLFSSLIFETVLTPWSMGANHPFVTVQKSLAALAVVVLSLREEEKGVFAEGKRLEIGERRV